MKTKSKRIIAILLTLATCLGILPAGLTAFAATGTVYMVSLPRASDPNQSGWGHGNLNLMNGWSLSSGTHTTAKSIGGYETDTVYCIELGINLNVGDSLGQKGEDFWNNYPNSLNQTISATETKLFIGRIFQYGWTGKNNLNWSSTNSTHVQEMAEMIATQLLIWETVIGERDGDFKKVNAASYGKNSILDSISSNHPLRSQILSHYNRIAGSVQSHVTLPSFFNKSTSGAQTFEMAWDGSKYSVTLTDANSVLDNFSFSSGTAGISFTTNGNKLTISATTPPTNTISITASKKSSNRKATVIWTDGVMSNNNSGQIQDLVYYGETIPDPITGYVKAKVSAGHLKLIKVSEDGVVANIPFHISGNGISKNVTTGASGEILVENLQAGTYTVTEGAIDRYEPQESRTVTIIGGQTSTVTFSNTLKRGDLQVIKSSEDNYKQGHKFHLYGTSLSGLKVDEYAVTNDQGVATFKDVLISGSTPYVLEEVDTAIRYVIPDSQTVKIQWNEVTKTTVTNKLKKFTVNLKKADSEKGNDNEIGYAQGDGSLANAKYGIFKGSELIDVYYTNTSGEFSTTPYVCGDDWSIRELEPSEGYLLDETVYHVGAEAKNFTLEHNPVSVGVTEDIIKSRLTLIKHSDNGETQIEHPETGATFTMYLTSKGPDCNPDERDILTVDEYGLAANTKDMPYGWYTIHQASGWEGKEKIPDFQVFLGSHNEMKYLIINNADITAKIRIEKRDGETGEIVKSDGIGFELYDPDGNKIIMHYDYPQPVDISTFYTVDGWLQLPESLSYGKGYKLVEVQTVSPYYLGDPVYFDVDGSETVVTVTQYNMPQKGKIHFDKYGEVFASVTESNGVYQPVYKVESLAGAVIDVYAAEDIIVNGDVKAKKDQFVSTVTTTQNGGETDLLFYPGLYYYIERTAPYGMTTSGQNVPKLVEITYAGQTVKETLTTATIYNERQKAEISFDKVMEQDELFNIGMNGELAAVQMGLYADSDITAADGKKIPKGGLIEIATVNIENGHGVFLTDLPVGAAVYLKEIATDEHYILSGVEYPLVFEYAGQDVQTVFLTANNGEAITNDIIRGRVEGVKLDEDGQGLAGAIIGLFRADDTEFTEENALMTAVSAEDGGFSFEGVPFGNWICREIAAPESYVLSETGYPVTVSEQDETIKVEMENRLIRGSVRTTKVDAEYPDNKLSGAVFDVFADTNGNGEYDEGVDLYIGTLEEIKAGIYQLDSLVYSGYFLHERTAPELFVKDENYYYFEILTDGEIVEVENQAGVGFINQPITGELWLTKKDVSDGKLIPNCGIRIKDADGNIVVEGRTDGNGEVRFTLRAGKYTYSEFDCEGYLLDTSEYPFEITEDGQIIKAEMTNEKIPVPEIPDVPKTGDNSNMILWLALMGASVAGLIGFGIAGKRKKSRTRQ